jgi:hypothetical protein
MIGAGPFLNLNKMAERKAIRYLVVTAALVALLVFGTTLGSVFHHHASSTDTNCSICHFTHQAMERPLVADRAPALASIGPRFEPQEPDFVASPLAPRLPARAPPSA